MRWRASVASRRSGPSGLEHTSQLVTLKNPVNQSDFSSVRYTDTMAVMERIVFVHGSVMGGRPTWNAQRVLDERFELDVWERPGFAPNPPVERVDFDVDAVALRERLLPGSHVVGHSAGGVVALLAAAHAPELIGSLTVIEPPAMDVARGVPAVDRFVADGSGVVDSRPARRP